MSNYSSDPYNEMGEPTLLDFNELTTIVRTKHIPKGCALLEDGGRLGPREGNVLDEDAGGSMRHLRQRNAVNLHGFCILANKQAGSRV